MQIFDFFLLYSNAGGLNAADERKFFDILAESKHPKGVYVKRIGRAYTHEIQRRPTIREHSPLQMPL